MCRWVGGQRWGEGREAGLVVVERQARLQAGAGRTVKPAIYAPRLPPHHCSAAGRALAAGAGAGRGHPVWLHRHRLAGGWGDAGVGGRSGARGAGLCCLLACVVLLDSAEEPLCGVKLQACYCWAYQLTAGATNLTCLPPPARDCPPPVCSWRSTTTGWARCTGACGGATAPRSSLRTRRWGGGVRLSGCVGHSGTLSVCVGTQGHACIHPSQQQHMGGKCWEAAATG